MKNTLTLSIMCILLCTGCLTKNNKSPEAAVAAMSTEDALPSGKTPSLTIDRRTKADDVRYHYVINREPNETTVTDDEGNVFYDNDIHISVEREGSTIYSHTLTRESFLSMLDEGFRRYGILDGCRFVKATAHTITFSLCVSYPESDLYSAFLYTIDKNGGISIAPDNTLDVDNFADSVSLSSEV